VSAYIHICPESVAAAVMQLIDEWKRGEIEPEEYNRRFAELQQEVKWAELEENKSNSGIVNHEYV